MSPPPQKAPSQALERLASGDESAAEHLKLQQKVRIGEVRVHQAIHLLRRQKAGYTSGGLQGIESFASSAATLRPEEIRANRKKDELIEAYRRLTRPERVHRNWTADRWALVSQVLSKLRGLACAAGWKLLPPATHLAKDPEAVRETGIDEPTNAAEAIDISEGAIEARILRIAVRLTLDKSTAGRVAEVKSWISPETNTFARMSLAHLRTTGLAIETLLDPEGLSPSAWAILAKAYCAFAGGIASLRQHLGDDIEKVLSAVQDPLSQAATAACKLGLAAGPLITPPGVQATATLRLARSLSKTPADVAKAVKEAARDPFKPLHQTTLLSSIALLSEVIWKSMDSTQGASSPQKSRRAEDGDAAKEDKVMDGATIADLAGWPVEFTSSQLGLVQRALRDRQPDVAGALALLQDTLDHYARLAEAMGRAYGDERTLRANPFDIAQHQGLISLVRQLRSSWRDTGAVLVPTRQADLHALERVRLRYQRLIYHAFRAGGHDVAAVVLARLALVDEMLEPPETRRLTGEVPWEWKRPYNLVEGVIRCLCTSDGGLAARQFRRRRRWLRCPHGTTRMVLAGDIWRQLFDRFCSSTTGFEGLGGCFDIPLTLREFRVANCFLELSFNERQLAMIYDSAADLTVHLSGGVMGGHATLRNLQRMVGMFGPQGSGDYRFAADAAAVAGRGVAEKEDEPSDGDSPRSPKVSNAPKALLAPTVCPRCLAGDMPNFPHVSVGELNRRHGPASNEGNPGMTQAQPTNDEEEVAARELSEDLMVGWATSVLADGILLSKDEQGAYFRWLARTVLYSTDPKEGEAGSKSPAASTKARSNRRRSQAHRRMSFASSLTAALPLLDGHSGPSQDNNAAAGGDGGAADGGADSLEAREEDLEGLQEVREDLGRSLPEAMLSALRIDVGLSPVTSSQSASAGDGEPKRKESFSLGHRRSATKPTSAPNMFALLQERIGKDEEERKAERANREAKLVSNLRAVGVPESELSFLHQEFILLAAEKRRKGNTEALLMGGASRAAQSIVVPNPALKLKQTQEMKESAATAASNFDGQAAGDECSNRATATAAVGRCAQELVDSSALHASHAYSRVCSGYMHASRRYRVAAALRLLEHELFSLAEGGRAAGSEGGGAAGDDVREKTSTLAYILLPRDTARKLILQQKRDEAVAAEVPTVPTAEALNATIVERRKAMASGLSVRVQSIEKEEESESDGSFQSTPSPSPSGSKRRRRPSANASPSQSPSRGGARSPKPSSPATPSLPGSSPWRSGKLRGAAFSRLNGRNSSIPEAGENSPAKREGTPSKREGSPFVLEASPSKLDVFSAPEAAKSAAFITDPPSEHWEDDPSDWPSSVRGLFDSVDASGERMRLSCRMSMYANDSRTKWLPKSKSIGSLPSSSTCSFFAGSTGGRGPASPSTTLRASGRHCARPADRIYTDGWRAKLPAAAESSSAFGRSRRQSSDEKGGQGHSDTSVGGAARRCGSLSALVSPTSSRAFTTSHA